MTGAGIGEVFSSTILSGSMWLAVAVAAAAGIVAFVSPCVLPVVPGYLGYVSGLAGQDSQEERRARRMLWGSLLFVGGFTVVFMVLGGFIGALGFVLQEHLVWVNRIAGVIVIVMGLLFLGAFPALSGTRAIAKRPDAGLWGAPLLGMVFGLSWTPCIGPTYAAVLALSLDGASPVRGGLLALAYSLGLGIPFVLFALGFQRALGASRFLARHRRVIGVISGALLIAIGVLLLTGQWSAWMGQLQGAIGGYETVV
ncbi:cytochrome c biogenesis CcdA family protein [Brachybacterium sp. AOP25-B2-12]|uniref:cytochrome c biogenesis CcdA family protein n=1 Tax=Brachybacterium sp. AOP25-B2-12 TaxID=3457710 RepID=UPI0040339244